MLQDISLNISEEIIREFCERHGVVELALFGSVLRSDFSLESDIDILVTFANDHKATLRELLTMEMELTKIFDRNVDLVERKAIQESQNYIRKQAILDSLVGIYAG